jgi:hypothetical protein
LDAPSTNPRNWIWPPRSRALLPGKKPELHLQKETLSTPAPPHAHPRPANPAERPWRRPGLRRRGRWSRDA